MSGLPSGFDPRKLTLGANAPIRRALPPREYVSTSNRSVWDWFNNLISTFGSWMTETGAYIFAFIAAAIPAIWGIIGLGGWVIGAFKDFFILGILALGAALFVACLGCYLVIAAFYLGFAVGWVFGWICYNAWTFLSALLVCGVIWWIVSLNNDSTPTIQQQQQVVETPAYTEYRCTAQKLNVRSAPSANARVIGTVLKGNVVRVYGFEGDFARIEWKTPLAYETAYVSRKYIER